MILNMTGAGNGAQLIPFTVENNTTINVSYFTVNNVKLHSGKVKGFFISRLENLPYGDGAIFEIFKELPITEVTEGLAQAIYYNSNETALDVYSTSSGTDFEYDDSTQTFKFRVRNVTIMGNGAYLSAGNYQLVIW